MIFEITSANFDQTQFVTNILKLYNFSDGVGVKLSIAVSRVY